MNRISRMLYAAVSMLLVLVAMPASSDPPLPAPIFETTSSGLFTFSREEKAIRVAAVFTVQDSAVVPTLVRFLDQNGNVLKQVRGDLTEGNAVVAELTRADVAGRGDLLVRVEVLHKLPGRRSERYSIMVSVQPIGLNGSGSWAHFWPGGSCGNPDPLSEITAGQPDPSGPIPASEHVPVGSSVNCQTPAFTAF